MTVRVIITIIVWVCVGRGISLCESTTVNIMITLGFRWSLLCSKRFVFVALHNKCELLMPVSSTLLLLISGLLVLLVDSRRPPGLTWSHTVVHCLRSSSTVVRGRNVVMLLETGLVKSVCFFCLMLDVVTHFHRNLLQYI